MKNLIRSIGMLLCLGALGCNSDEVRDLKTTDGKPIINRSCDGDYYIIHLEKGKCRNECTRGISIYCNGYRIKNRCGRITYTWYTCNGSYSESVDFGELPILPPADTADAVRVKLEILDRYHARFVFLEDISAELALESDFTITNNIRLEDDLGYTFSGNTYYNFQFIGGDYPIDVSSLTYPYGFAVVDISSY